MTSKEKLPSSTESSSEIIDSTKKSLSLLEKDTRIWFFKKASDWVKKLFWFSPKEETSSDEQNGGRKKAQIDSSSTSHSTTLKLIQDDFSPWAYPFKHITTPYKWIPAYRVDNIKLNPLLWFNQLSLKWTEWNLTTLKVKDLTPKFSTKTAWYKKNNPCNVSPFKGDIWRTGSSNVADWQNHSKYNSMEDWLASFMRLMRQPRYRNKSIQWINCSWMQWIYNESEPDSLKALRITRITHACENLHVSPFDRLNTDDKETMMAFAQQTAINESWSYFDKATLERAYEKAFW